MPLIIVTSPVFAGSLGLLPASTTPVDVPLALGLDLVGRKAARWDVDPNWDIGVGAVSAAMAAALSPTVISGRWRGFPAVTMRLRMTGTGTLTMDSRNAAGAITSSVYTYAPAGVTVVDYAYPGDDAVEIRITLTGTATAEVI